jgi:O-antigen/teichoic acid export membrane protein
LAQVIDLGTLVDGLCSEITVPWKRHLKELLLVLFGKLLTQGSMVFSSLLVARTTNPVEFGIFSSALVLIVMIDAMAGSPLDNAALRFAGLHGTDHDRTIRVQSLIFRIKIAIGLSIFLLTWPFREEIANILFGNKHQVELLSISLIGAVGLLMLRGTSAFLQNHKDFRHYSLMDITIGLSRIVIISALYLHGVTISEPYLIAYVAVTYLVFVAMIVCFKQPYLIAGISRRSDIYSCLHFASITLGIAVIGTISGKADLLIASSLYGSKQAGQYAVAYQIAQFGTMLAFYVCVITQPRIIPMAINNKLAKLMCFNIAMVILVALALAPVAIAMTPAIVPTLFGPAFSPASELTMILLLGVLADWLTIPVFFPLGILIFPRGIFLGEVFLLLAYGAAVYYYMDYGIQTFAFLVVANRFAHFLVYGGFGWYFLKMKPESRRTLLSV